MTMPLSVQVAELYREDDAHETSEKPCQRQILRETQGETDTREKFLSEMEMDKIVPWKEMCALIEPFYPKGKKGRPPVGIERMLRINILQQWFNLSDPAAEETLYDIESMRRFAGIDLGTNLCLTRLRSASSVISSRPTTWGRSCSNPFP